MKNVVENMWLKFFLTLSLPWGLRIPGDGEDSDIGIRLILFSRFLLT